MTDKELPCEGLDPDTDPCPFCGAGRNDPCKKREELKYAEPDYKHPDDIRHAEGIGYRVLLTDTGRIDIRQWCDGVWIVIEDAQDICSIGLSSDQAEAVIQTIQELKGGMSFNADN